MGGRVGGVYEVDRGGQRRASGSRGAAVEEGELRGGGVDRAG